MKSVVIPLFISILVLLTACENVDLSKVSDQDLQRVSDKLIVCNKPYMRYASGCCLDKDFNSICDRDERELTETEKRGEEEVSKGQEPSGVPKEPQPKEENILLLENVGKLYPIGMVKDNDIENINVNQASNEEFFTLTDTEYQNLEKAEIRFMPYCSSITNIGVLDILVNNTNIFSAVPICDDRYKQDIPVSALSVGQNSLIFKTSGESYLIKEIKLSFTEKDMPELVYYFEIDPTILQDVGQEKVVIKLQINFIDDQKIKKFDLRVNDHLLRVERYEKDYSSDITSFLKSETNFIKLIPKTIINISKLKITRKDAVTGIKTTTDERTAKEIERTLNNKNNVTIPFDKKTIKNGEFKTFSIGILNVLNTNEANDFKVTITFDKAFDKENNKICDLTTSSSCGFPQNWVQTSQDTSNLVQKTIQNNQKETIEIGMNVNNAPQGVYVFDVRIDYKNLDIGDWTEYGTPHKLYVEVP